MWPAPPQGCPVYNRVVQNLSVGPPRHLLNAHPPHQDTPPPSSLLLPLRTPACPSAAPPGGGERGVNGSRDIPQIQLHAHNQIRSDTLRGTRPEDRPCLTRAIHRSFRSWSARRQVTGADCRSRPAASCPGGEGGGARGLSTSSRGGDPTPAPGRVEYTQRAQGCAWCSAYGPGGGLGWVG